MKIIIEPIGFVYSERKEAIDDNWNNIYSWIQLNDNFSKESLDGLNDFSHLEIIYYFHKVDSSEIIIKSEHPRENLSWPKVGIFSQRKKARPNLLGTTICKILKIEDKRVYVLGLDAIDQTPVIDIKPVFKEYLPNDISKVKQPIWVSELMSNYW